MTLNEILSSLRNGSYSHTSIGMPKHTMTAQNIDDLVKALLNFSNLSSITYWSFSGGDHHLVGSGTALNVLLNDSTLNNIAKVLSNAPNLVKLEIEAIHFTVQGAQILSQALENSNVAELKLSRVFIIGDDRYFVASMFSRSKTSILTLHPYQEGITIEDVKSFSNKLQYSSIVELKLDYCYLNDEMLTVIANKLPQSMTILYINYGRFTITGANALANKIKSSNIKTLFLMSCNFSKEMAQSLLDIIPYSHLIDVRINNNVEYERLCDSMEESIREAQENNQRRFFPEKYEKLLNSLLNRTYSNNSYLYLGSTCMYEGWGRDRGLIRPITPKMLRDLARVLPSSSITELNFGACKLSDECLIAIAESLPNIPQLAKLDIGSDQNFTIAGIRALVTALPNSSVSKLDFGFYNGFTSESAALLLNMVKQSRLTSLELEYTNLTEESVKRFSEAVEQNRHRLTRLADEQKVKARSEIQHQEKKEYAPTPAVAKTMPMLPPIEKTSTRITSVFSVIPSSALTISHKVLGEGGFGVVFQGKWQLVDVAIKQLKSARLSEETLASFLEEARRHGALRHPNILTLFGVCTEQGRYSMVMELMPMGSLYDVLHSNRELTWSMRFSIARHMAIGLAYLHEQAILHRDFKSMNVLLDDRMTAKLSDFGLSKNVKLESSTSTHANKNLGTLLWMAPELLTRGAKHTVLSDIYALGIVLWELTSRKLPFQDDETATPDNIRQWIKDGEKETIPSDTPPQFTKLIVACWAQRIEDRPSNCGDIANKISTIEGSFTSSGYLWSKSNNNVSEFQNKIDDDRANNKCIIM